jgi:hypothetical protein
MAKTATTETSEGPVKEGLAEHSSLRFDQNNPRSGDRDFSTEDDVLKFLIRHADVDELVTSMQSAGWVDFEPIIVQRKSNIVLEGNRRLAALRFLTDEATRNRIGYKIPNNVSIPHLPKEIRVRWVADRNEARAFIAFKHINGPFKWDALAKAKYAAQWLEEDDDVDAVSKQIGDTHKTVLRLVNGWRVLEQAKKNGFDEDDITARRFNFSHLYTALARPNTRSFLGLSEDPNSLLPRRPVKKDNFKALEELMGWLFGQSNEGRQHVIVSQNPDLNRLVKVLGSKQARAVLTSTKNFARAFEIVEPASTRFEEALVGTANTAEKSLGLVSHYDPRKQPTLMDTMKGLADTVRALRDQMRKKVEGGDDL